MRKEEAEAKLIDKRISRSMTFCPLTKALCVENCECYYPGEVRSSSGGRIEEQGLHIQHDIWYVDIPRCTCHSLVGDEER